MATINSMPRNDYDGYRDLSVPPAILTAKQYPTLLPVWFFLGAKGPKGRFACDGPAREQLFGAETFREGSKFYNHQTLFATRIGNMGIYHRVMAENAKAAGMRLWIDVLATQIPLYERGSDGKYLLDMVGRPKPTGSTVPGFKIKFVKTPIGELFGGAFGEASQMTGDQVDALGTQSIRYPFEDLPVSSEGDYGNNIGTRRWAPTTNSRTTVDAEMLEDNKAFSYVFSCQNRSVDGIQNISTIDGSQEFSCVFKRKQVKASVGRMPFSYEDRFFTRYNDRQRPNLNPLYGPFDRTHLYYENLEELLGKFYDAERPFIDMFSDFTDEGHDEMHRFNFIGGRTSRGVPYHSFLIEKAASNAEAMSDISTSWAEGGSDGDTDLTTFDRLVRAEVTKYGNIDEQVTENRLGNPESIFFDSGFSSDTKMAMANIISVRKDIFLVWCLRDAQQARPLTADEESSLCIALFTRGQMMPESVHWGTPASRAMIVACDGTLISNPGLGRQSLSLEIGAKSGQYMGAVNGQWPTQYSFSNGDRANVTMFNDVNVTWRPVSARERDWANGMVYVQNKDMETLYFPGLRTICPVPQSIMTSFMNNMIFIDLAKVADRVHAQFSGADQYSNEQFKKHIEAECRRQVEGKYDNRVVLNFYVTFSAVDEFNGFSWTLNVDVGAANMKTVQRTIITGYRRESMPAAI